MGGQIANNRLSSLISVKKIRIRTFSIQIKSMRKVVILLLLVNLSFDSYAQNGTDPVKVTDMLKIKSIGGVSLNKDASMAVFTVTSIEPEGESKTEYKYVNQVWLTSTAPGSTPKQMTSKENATQPTFSPDGKQVAFVRTVDGKAQIFLLAIDGGEAIQLTRYKYGASNPKWSPDGKKILFAASIPLKDLLSDSILNPRKETPRWPSERPGMKNNDHMKHSIAKQDPDGNMEEIRAYLNNNAADKKAKVLYKLNFLDEMDVNADLNFNHFFIVDAKTDAKPIPVTKGFFRYDFADFMPDGKQLILGADIDSTEHPHRSLEGEIFIVNTDGTGLRKILGEAGKNFNSPRVSPSGKWLSFQHGNTSFVSIQTLSVMPLNGSVNDKKDIPFDRTKGNYTWSDDERFIYFSAQSNGAQPVYRANVATKEVEQLTDLESGIGSFDIAGNRMVYAKTEIQSPFELYTADANARNAQRLGNFNAGWLSSKKLSIPEKHSFKNEKGLTVEYWIMKPANYEAGKKYPLLLEIHGGPSAMWGPGESTMWHEYQYFTSKGYGVVYSNPRGSGGYGLDFLRGNVNDWGAGPTSDVLTALDKTIAEGWADTSKLVVTGGSYAGYLVAWIIAHDQRFAAACSQRGVYDLATFFGEGNAWRLVPNYFGGYPWEPETKATLERESPINYVQHIRTPYIIFHGDNDRRTGFVQSEMMYKSLKALGRPVEYVRHPGGTHELTRSGNNRQRIDQMLRTYEFFERWIRK
jgi:dipeptidyl aminopeptidase/acylaminoacyl peptidase